MQTRRGALTTLASAVALTAKPFGPLRAQTAGNGTLRAAFLPDFAVAPVFAAQAQGYFADEHLTLVSEAIEGGGAAMIPALVAGDFDVAYANPTSVALAVSRGIDLRILAASPGVTNQPPSTAALVKRAGTPYSTGKDLAGQQIAVNALSGVQWMVARSWIKATGGDPDKVGFLEIPIPAMTAALDANRVAGALLIDPFLTVALGQPQKYAVLAWPFNVVYAFIPTGLWVCMNQFIETKAPLAQAFVRAYRRGVVWVNENRGKDALIQLMASYAHLDPNVLRKMNVPPSSPTVNTSRFGALIDMMLDNKLLTKKIDLAAQVYVVPDRSS